MLTASRWVAASLIAMTVAGCIGGERLLGPTLTVRNDSAVPIVVRVDRSKWEVPTSESGYLGSLSFRPATSVEILDATTCAVLDTVAVSFQPDMDQLVTVPVIGAATSRAITTADRAVPTPSRSTDPSRCVGPADGINVSVENRSSKSYDLVARSASGDLVGYLLELPGHGSGPLIGNGVLSWGAAKGGPDRLMAAGVIDLIDPASCRILSSVEYPDFGSFTVTIDEAGDMTIANGPLPTGRDLSRKGVECVPGATPQPAASGTG